MKDKVDVACNLILVFVGFAYMLAGAITTELDRVAMGIACIALART